MRAGQGEENRDQMRRRQGELREKAMRIERECRAAEITVINGSDGKSDEALEWGGGRRLLK